jgi:TRAP transporter TAXI family solute receptor
MAVAIADAMQKEKGITLRVVPVGTDVGRTTLLSSGRAHVLFQGFGAYAAFEGVQGFDAMELGPQPLQLINAGLPTMGSLSVTAKDANIKTWADLKGKRVAYIDGYPAVSSHSDATIAFAGLTWDDVKKVKFTSFGAMGRGMIEGTVDVGTCSTTSAYVYELASSPRGVQWVPYPHADTEGWKRMNAIMPILTRAIVTQGAGLSKDNKLEGSTYPNPHLITSATADPEFVYQMTKLMVELYPIYGKAQAPGIDQFDPERLILDYVMPYHEGAVRYYKEIGKWTAAAQKNNDVMLNRQKILFSAWEEALSQAAIQKVQAADFPKFWMNLRAKRLEAAGLPAYFK